MIYKKFIKNTIFSNRNKDRNKNNYNYDELKYFPMSEGNNCIAEPNLEVLPLIWFGKGLVSFFLLKVLKTDV